MIYAFNILTVVLVLLIAYWWANQGLFSAIIHLLCVIVAGAIALAFWEPLTVGLLLRGNPFDNYAWGVGLIGLFVVSLFILRLATNKLVPANVDLPHWANLAFGFPVGAAAGVLAIGLLLIGAGFIQSQREVLGYVGTARSARTGKVEQRVGPAMWAPFHRWTGDFYSWLSVNSLSTSRPLRHYYPNLGQQAASLMRDSARDGRAQISLQPSEATIQAVYLCSDLRRCAVSISFHRGAKDFGEQLTISAAQLRLIANAQGKSKPYVAHPVRWTQQIKGGAIKTFAFDDMSHYITSVPGRDTADVMIEFEFPDNLEPHFIQIKGTRYDILRRVQKVQRQAYISAFGRVATSARATPPDTSGARPIDSADIQVSNTIRPVSVSTNMLPGGMKVTKDKYLLEGDALFKRGGRLIARSLRILGIHEPPDTKIVQLNISRGRSSADVFGPVRERAGAQAAPVLVDSQGNEYSAIGYFHESPRGVRIVLDLSEGIRSLDDLPHLPTSGEQKLRLVFRVTEGVTIVAFRLGNVTVGTCNLNVSAAGSVPVNQPAADQRIGAG